MIIEPLGRKFDVESGYSDIGVQLTSCIVIALMVVSFAIFGILPFIHPLIRPIGKNITESAITPPILLPPFLQLLSLKETRLLSMVFVVALVRHILPALPHDPLGSALNSKVAGVPFEIRTFDPSAE